jgi:YD repeat-containing protein
MAIVSLGLTSGQDADGVTYTLKWDEANSKLIVYQTAADGTVTTLTQANAFV